MRRSARTSYGWALTVCCLGFAGCAGSGPFVSEQSFDPPPQTTTTGSELVTLGWDEEGSNREFEASVEPVKLETPPMELQLPQPTGGSPDVDERVDRLPLLPGQPIDFGTALATASGQNPQVAFAHARIRAAYADLASADVLWLPDMNVGASIYRHDGVLQPGDGRIAHVDRNAYYAGGGARAAGTGLPSFPGLSLQFHLADAIYQPRIAAHTANARRREATATTNDLLLDTALAYLDLLEAHQLKAITVQTVEMAASLEELTRNFADAGQGARADADRALTELMSREDALLDADEDARVAAARLSQRLSLPAHIPLAPLERQIVPIDLVPVSSDPRALLDTAFHRRPELAQRHQEVAAACARLRRERAAPLVPNLVMGASYGGFGGGRNSDWGNFDDRFDFDAAAFWNVRNLGFGEQAARADARAEVDRTRAEVAIQMDQIAREVMEAFAQLEVRSRRLEVTREAVQSAISGSMRDLRRIREGEGKPIEVLHSIGALDTARRNYLRAIVEYNEAQFRLQRALGWPIGPVELARRP